MKTPLSTIYQNSINEKIAFKVKEPDPITQDAGRTQAHELWSRDKVSEEIIDQLISKRESLLVAAMKGSDSIDQFELRGLLKEAHSLTKTIKLMKEGTYE